MVLMTKFAQTLFIIAGLLMVALSVGLMCLKIDVSQTEGFLLAVGFLFVVFPYLPPLKLVFGKDGIMVEIRNIQKKLVKLEQHTAGDSATLAAVQNQTAAMVTSTKLRANNPFEGDVARGTYGKSASENGRKLEAFVTRLGSTELAKVKLVVSREAGFPRLKGMVTFHLHPTFAPRDHPAVPVNANGCAELEITSYGAFIAGASADQGVTKLELDLAKAPGTFSPWRER
jgi:hypothetical protein